VRFSEWRAIIEEAAVGGLDLFKTLLLFRTSRQQLLC
jgi:hypothetical protein